MGGKDESLSAAEGLLASWLGILIVPGIYFGVVEGKKYLSKVVKEDVLMSEVSSQKISSIDVRDVNNDELEDVVMEYHSGDKNIFYDTGNGYQTVEQIRAGEIKRIEDGYQKQLRETNEFYRKAFWDVNGVGGGE